MTGIFSPYWHPVNSRGFILDWDGVLADTKLDFSGIREKYFNGKRVPLIESDHLLTSEQRKQLWKDIYELEMYGATHAVAVDGALSLVEWLGKNDIPWAVVSRNCMDSILEAAEKIGFPLPEVTMSRDDGPQKPDPDALLLAARRIGIQPSHCVMVGDFLYDMVGARRAGTRAVLVERVDEDWSFWADVCFPTVSEMVTQLEEPDPFVPWEYHSLVRRKGRKWLERAWELELMIDGNEPEAAGLVFKAFSLGAGSISIDPEARVSMGQWERWAGASPGILDIPLSEALRNYVEGHYPLVSVNDSHDGAILSGDGHDLEKQMEEMMF